MTNLKNQTVCQEKVISLTPINLPKITLKTHRVKTNLYKNHKTLNNLQMINLTHFKINLKRYYPNGLKIVIILLMYNSQENNYSKNVTTTYLLPNPIHR